ncbi:MAG: hypothetical protein LBN32_04970 [Helicobacteraceae bacterium]|jgi:uncharacterized protein|nr:hypothetical protein [Helicobacteraceae bacterium]
MVRFLAVLIGFCALIAIFIFGRKKQHNHNSEIEELIKCENCGIYISQKEAIIKSGKYFCSKSCAGLK